MTAGRTPPAVRGALAVVAWIAGVAVSSPAAAEPPTAGEQAVAEQLFLEGRRLVAEGRYAEGCRKLEDSQRIDPAIGTQFHLADCYVLTGRLASAWSQFLHVAGAAHAAGQAPREQIARRRAAELQPRLSFLRVE